MLMGLVKWSSFFVCHGCSSYKYVIVNDECVMCRQKREEIDWDFVLYFFFYRGLSHLSIIGNVGSYVE